MNKTILKAALLTLLSGAQAFAVICDGKKDSPTFGFVFRCNGDTAACPSCSIPLSPTRIAAMERAWRASGEAAKTMGQAEKVEFVLQENIAFSADGFWPDYASLDYASRRESMWAQIKAYVASLLSK